MPGPESLSLVLPPSRAAGLAPYGSLGLLRLSRPALLYSYVLHLALSMLSVYLVTLVDISTLGHSEIIFFVNMVFLELIIWIAVIRGPKNLRDVLFVLTRVKQICREVNFNDAKNIAHRKIRRVFIFMAFVSCGGVLQDMQLKLMLVDRNDYKFVTLSSQVMLYDMKRIILLLLTTQFVILATKINSALRGVNRGLEQLYTEMCPHGGLDKYDKNHLTVLNDIIYGVGFINVKPKIVATFDHLSAPRRLRSLACAYVSTCDVARKLCDAAGLLLFLLLTFSILNLIQEIYYVIVNAGGLNIEDLPSVLLFSCSMLNCVLHIGEFILLVAPCHDFSEELENTRYLVSHLSCEASSCGDALRAELDVFFIHLNANQPQYSALGVYTLRRPLLLKVATFVVTYLAVLLGF